MKYIKTIDLWQDSNEKMIREGQLKLQSGQWVRCGPDAALSRFVKSNRLNITVIHGGTTQEANSKYKRYISLHKKH